MKKPSSSEFLRGKPTTGNREQILAALFKITPFVIIFFGMWFSTQRFAYLMSYDPSYIGYPFYVTAKGYPLYYPWTYFSWFMKYAGKQSIWPILKEAIMPLVLFSASAVIIYTFLVFLRGFRQKAENIFGTARWGTIKDLKKAGLLISPSGQVYGQLFNAKVNAELNVKTGSVSLHLEKPTELIIQGGITNTLVAAPTRSGKGVGIIIPTLLSYAGSTIILDTKGENFNFTSGFRSTFSDVYRYAPVGDVSHGFNPIMEIPGGKDAYRYANMIADVLTTPQAGKAGGNENSEHFRETALEFLTGTILHVLCSDYKDKTLPGVKDFLSQVNPEDPEDDTYALRQMIKARHCNDEIHRRVVAAAGNQLNRPDKERGSVLSTVNKALRVFEDTRVRETSLRHEIHIDDFEKSDRPVSLYLTMPYSDLSRLAPLIRLFFMFFIRRFSSGETQHNDRKLKIPMLFILDEFPTLGKFSELQEVMGILCGFGCHFMIVVQSPNQLVDLYGRNHQFLAHCKNVILFAPGEIESAKTCSEIIGKESIWQTNTSTSGSRFSVGLDNMSLSGSERERNLINPDEIMKLPPDQFILLTQGSVPYIGKKVVYYEDRRFSKRLKPPAFTTREQALKQCAHNLKRAEEPHWFDLPLFTCFESFEDIVIDPRLIDPRLIYSQDTVDTSTQNDPERDGEFEQDELYNAKDLLGL